MATYLIIGGIGLVILFIAYCILIIKSSNKRVKSEIDSAPQIAEEMNPGQKIVKELSTTGSEAISKFLESFPTDQFSTHVQTRHIRRNDRDYYTTLVTIVKFQDHQKRR